MAEAKKASKKSSTNVVKPVKKTAVQEKAIIDKVKKADKKIVTKEAKEIVEEAKVEETKVVAKAGKRSAKAIAEVEEKQAKEERKSKVPEREPELKKKPAQKPARSKLERRSKNYRKAAELVNKDNVYSLEEGIDLASKTSLVKFDASVELHVNLNVDPRQADQNIRGTVVLPAGTGKSARVAVFGETDEVATAKKAGADIAAGDEFLQQLDKGSLNFDILIASPKVMPKLGKYAKILGPKGLMPNPKSGTVTTNVAKAVTEAKAGRVEYRIDSTAIIHVAVGKVSFGTEKLVKNAQAVIASIKSAKPASLKGVYIKSAFVTTSMGPSIKISL